MTAIDIETAQPTEPARTPVGATALTTRDMTRGGLVLSGVLHLAVLLLVVFGLPSLFRHPPPQESSIAVNLVMIAPETRATHKNPYRPKPEAKPEPPVAAPAPKPEPKPEPPKPVPEPPASASAPPPPPAPPEPAKPEAKAPPAPPPPPPKPVEAHAAPLPSPAPPPEVKPRHHIHQAHHAPPPPTTKPSPADFDKLLKTLAQKHPEPPKKLVKAAEQRHREQEFDALLQNLTREATAEADDAPPAPHRVAATAPPSSQPKAPLGSQLTASDIDLVREKLRPCFNPPFGAKEKPDLFADVRVVMNPDGTVQQARVADLGQYRSDQVYRAVADAGIRALRNPECSPLPLPSDRFDLWQTFVFGFSTRDMQ
ncbi:MAG: hypothetical protein ACM3JG_05410 [Thiohalocapsa sp.]